METSTETRPRLMRQVTRRIQAAARYDCFPVFSARVRRVFYNPFGVLLLAAVSALLCGFFLHPQGFVLFGGVATVLVLGVSWPWLNLRCLHGSISFERTRASEGERLEGALTLRNRLPWSAWGLAIRGGFCDQTCEDLDATIVSIAVAPARRSIRCRWSFAPGRRGVYPLEVPQLATGFPFGLWENTRVVSVDAPLLVWPRTFPVGPVPLVDGERQVEGNVTRNKVGTNGDVLGVRPYRRGDSPRRIHWAQSARHDRLIVCELQSNARPLVQLVLDADPRIHSGRGSHGSREWAIRIVASFAKGWLEAGAQVGAVWNGDVIPAASGQSQLQRLLDSLARLPDRSTPSLAETLNHPYCRNFSDGLQVIITTDSAMSQASLPPIDRDRQRWVLLHAAAFTANDSESVERPATLQVHPWIWIDSPDSIPALLHGGWKEAQHGS